MRENVIFRSIRLTAITLLMANGYILFIGKDYSQIVISNISFTFGLTFIIIGFFRITRVLRFYDLTIFGIKKLIEIIFTLEYKKSESKTGDYYQYLNSKQYNNPIIEFLAVGILLIAISLVTGVLM